jgi:hypothetical protein
MAALGVGDQEHVIHISLRIFQAGVSFLVRIFSLGPIACYDPR